MDLYRIWFCPLTALKYYETFEIYLWLTNFQSSAFLLRTYYTWENSITIYNVSELRRYFDYSKNLNKKIKLIRIKLNYSTNPAISARGNSIVYPPHSIANLPSRLPRRLSPMSPRHSPDSSCPIYPLQRPWFTSTWRFHPRENIQFASDARRDRAEILIGLLGFVSTRDNCGKKRKEKSEAICRLFMSFVCGITYAISRVESVNQIDSSKGANPILEFSCAICDRFGAINRSVRYSEFI